MSVRQLPFMIIAVILYFLLVSIVRVPLDSVLFTMPMPSGDRLAFSLGELLISLTAILMFVETVSNTSASASAIVNHGLSLVVFLICLLLWLLMPRFGTGTFFVMMLLTLIDTVAGYSNSILRARRDLTVEQTL
jgi:hypothetical protein